MKIFSTKDCLTKGIEEHDIEEDDIKSYGFGGRSEFVLSTINNITIQLYGKGVEWHISHEDAIIRAEEIKSRKLELLNRKIRKITAVCFK